MAYLIKGAHVVDPQVGLDDVRDVLVEGKTIAEVAESIEPGEGIEVIDGTDKYLVPGMVDMHVHFRDPGFEYKETIETGSRAAAHGGFTDVDMDEGLDMKKSIQKIEVDVLAAMTGI